LFWRFTLCLVFRILCACDYFVTLLGLQVMVCCVLFLVFVDLLAWWVWVCGFVLHNRFAIGLWCFVF